MNKSKIAVTSLCAMLLCVGTSYAIKIPKTPKKANVSTQVSRNVARATQGGQVSRSAAKAAKTAAKTTATRTTQSAAAAASRTAAGVHSAVRQPSLTPAEMARFQEKENYSFEALKKLSKEELVDSFVLMRAGQGIPEAQVRREAEDMLFGEEDLARAKQDAAQAGLPVPTKNLPLPKEGIQMLRQQVRAIAGQGGIDHAVSLSDLTQYQLAAQEDLSAYQTRAQEEYSYGLNIGGKYSSALNFAEENSGLWLPVPDKVPHFVHRETGIIGYVLEVPEGVIIDDGVHAAQTLNPQTQVIFYAADPAARVTAFVEERSNLLDPHQYNFLWPRSFRWMPAEQPIPANAGQTLIDRTEIEETVESYISKYYK